MCSVGHGRYGGGFHHFFRIRLFFRRLRSRSQQKDLFRVFPGILCREFFLRIRRFLRKTGVLRTGLRLRVLPCGGIVSLCFRVPGLLFRSLSCLRTGFCRSFGLCGAGVFRFPVRSRCRLLRILL